MGLPSPCPPRRSYPRPTSCPVVGFRLVFTPSRILAFSILSAPVSQQPRLPPPGCRRLGAQGTMCTAQFRRVKCESQHQQRELGSRSECALVHLETVDLQPMAGERHLS